jgi:UDP-N-acetylmuramate dehydrogenase
MTDLAQPVLPAPALSTLTTMRVGGTPHTFLAPRSTAQLVDTVRDVWQSGENWILLAGGSNTVASDREFEGTVVHIATRGIDRIPDGSAVRLRVQAGESWDGLVAHAVRSGWSGIESLAGIPGSVGAAPVQNIGAYGQELSSTLVAVEFLDYETGEIRRIPASELGLGYRTSALKTGMAGVVLAVELELTDGNEQLGAPLSQPIAYAQLADALGVTLGSRVPVAELRRTVLRLRASKGMLLDDSDPDSTSAGSFFTNPIVRENFARSLPVDAPRWFTEPVELDVVTTLDTDVSGLRAAQIEDVAYSGDVQSRFAGRDQHLEPYTVKLSAAWLIEQSGIRRGYSLPGSRAAVSSKHTLAVTNRGGATADEIIQLASFMQSRVHSEFGVILQPEPVLVGLSL